MALINLWASELHRNLENFESIAIVPLRRPRLNEKQLDNQVNLDPQHQLDFCHF